MADDTLSSASSDGAERRLRSVRSDGRAADRAPTISRSSAGGFARAMSQAFTQSTSGGKQLDDVMKNLGAAGLQPGGDAGAQAGGERHQHRAQSVVRWPVRHAAVQRRRREPRRRDGRDQAVRLGRRDRHADLFSALDRRPRPCRRSRARSDPAADARRRRQAWRRQRRAAAAATSRSRSRRRTSTVSAARKAISPARSRARSARGQRSLCNDRPHSTKCLFPLDIALKSAGGPERKTDIVALGSGREERNARWANSRRRYDAGYGVKTFVGAVRGRRVLRGAARDALRFPLARPARPISAAPGSAITPLDQVIGTGDGTTATFQLVKTYGSVYAPYLRTIAKPVPGSVRVAVAGTRWPRARRSPATRRPGSSPFSPAICRRPAPR